MRAIVNACLATALFSCRTAREQKTAAEVPAVIVRSTAESRAALAQAVSDALNGAPVTLADDAFTLRSSLVVERARQRDASGRPLSGRDTGMPEHFRLVKNGDLCILVHERTGRRFALQATDCVRAA